MVRRQPLFLDLLDPVPPKHGVLKEVRKPEVMTPELAFVIGCVVAEGSNTHKRVSFSNSDPAFISRYAECFHAVFGFLPSRNKVVEKGSVRTLQGVDFVANADGYDVYADSRAVVGWLGELGLYCGGTKDGKSASHHKVVPWAILQADERSQWAFLAAYLEGDGSIRPTTGRITFCSASPHIRQQLQVLLGAHGILSKVEDRFVYLNAVDSMLLWEKIQPWMVTKGFKYTGRDTKARNRYGIPADYIRGFLSGRKQDTSRAVYATDGDGLRTLPDIYETVRKVQRLLHDAYARGDFNEFMTSFKVISPDEHTKLQRLFDLGYQYVEVTSVEDAGKQDVFDISMGGGVEPAFVANGVVVHNTLMWRLLDVAQGPERAEIIDLTGCGLRDLQEGVLKCPRDPDIVFADDPTRLLRAIKFVARYGFKIPPDLAASIRRNAPRMKQAPWEAIGTLLVEDVLDQPTARSALKFMEGLGLISVIAEMIQTNKPFASYLAGQLNRHNVALLLDLADLGLPVKSPITFLTRPQQERLRGVTTPMSEAEAKEYLAVLRQPPLDNMALIEKYRIPPQERGTISQVARDLLLGNPALAGSPTGLQQAVDRYIGFIQRKSSTRHPTAGVEQQMAETKEKIPGGRARGKKPEDFDAKELAMGIKVEQEHLEGGDYSKEELTGTAREIAMDHLAEFPDYYTRLKKMEAEGEKAKEKNATDLRVAWGFPMTKRAWEVYVDPQGMAHDDEGNSWSVGHNWSEGTYFGEDASRLCRMAPRETAYRPPARVNQAQLDALDALLSRREDSFVRSIRNQVAAGRRLSEKQLSAVRRNFHRMRMEPEADLFRAASEKSAAERGNRSNVGLFIPLPEELAEEYPVNEEDPSPPHVTLLYVGEVPKDREEEFIGIVSSVLMTEPGPIRAWTNGVDKFVHPTDPQTVFFTPIRFSRDLGMIRDRITLALGAKGFPVANSFPLAYTPHTTLEYRPGTDHEHGYEGLVPDGAWEFSSIEIWGLPKVHEIPLDTFDREGIRLEDTVRNDVGILREVWGKTLSK
jgi:2'-5' RNA ligase